jgi:hypothetical protein
MALNTCECSSQSKTRTSIFFVDDGEANPSRYVG